MASDSLRRGMTVGPPLAYCQICLGLSQLAIQGFAKVMGKCQVIAYQHLAQHLFPAITESSSQAAILE